MINQFLTWTVAVLREVLSPFELLYLSIAIATFNHTVWSAAFLFEGQIPADNAMANFNGWLLAIAIDAGMILTSRFLMNAHDRRQQIVLVLSFIVAAVASAYFQMVYISFHTPIFTFSSGVDVYWKGILEPLLAARVILIPLALPILASVYTVARIFRHAATVLEREPIITIEKPKNDQPTTFEILRLLVDAILKAPDVVPAGHEILTLGAVRVDLRNLTFVVEGETRLYGPYKQRRMLVTTMLNLADRLEAMNRPPTLPPGGDSTS